MGSVSPFFHAERWVTAWEACGVALYVGRGPFGPNRKVVDDLLALGPVFARDLRREGPLRDEVQRLRVLLDQPGAREAAIR